MPKSCPLSYVIPESFNTAIAAFQPMILMTLPPGVCACATHPILPTQHHLFAGACQVGGAISPSLQQ
jgi:hypothetical protein